MCSRRSSGKSPACTSDVLPSPDAPNSTVSGALHDQPAQLGAFLRRPLKNRCAASSKDAQAGPGVLLVDRQPGAPVVMTLSVFAAARSCSRTLAGSCVAHLRPPAHGCTGTP